MELSNVQRELISRGTAMVVGLGFAFLAFGCYRWAGRVEEGWAPSAPHRAGIGHAAGVESSRGLPLGIMTLTGGLALAFCGYAVLPISFLHRIDPTPAQMPDGD